VDDDGGIATGREMEGHVGLTAGDGKATVDDGLGDVLGPAAWRGEDERAGGAGVVTKTGHVQGEFAEGLARRTRCRVDTARIARWRGRKEGEGEEHREAKAHECLDAGGRGEITRYCLWIVTLCPSGWRKAGGRESIVDRTLVSSSCAGRVGKRVSLSRSGPLGYFSEWSKRRWVDFRSVEGARGLRFLRQECVLFAVGVNLAVGRCRVGAELFSKLGVGFISGGNQYFIAEAWRRSLDLWMLRV